MVSKNSQSTMSISLYAHLTALREEQDKFLEERDRRYTEVKNAEEKALQIKEKADTVALELARQIQTYKDEQHNNLAAQINRERGLYATKADLTALSDKIDATVKPLVTFVAAARGGNAVYGQLAIAVGLIISAIALFIKL